MLKPLYCPVCNEIMKLTVDEMEESKLECKKCKVTKYFSNQEEQSQYEYIYSKLLKK